MTRKFAQTINETPDGWGNETLYCDDKRLTPLVKSLRELGDDWLEISSDECTEYEFVKQLDSKTALYEGGWHTDGYNRNGRNSAIVFGHDTEIGYYRWVESYDSMTEFESYHPVTVEG